MWFDLGTLGEQGYETERGGRDREGRWRQRQGGEIEAGKREKDCWRSSNLPMKRCFIIHNQTRASTPITEQTARDSYTSRWVLCAEIPLPPLTQGAMRLSLIHI
jgi:hypothetical protein